MALLGKIPFPLNQSWRDIFSVHSTFGALSYLGGLLVQGAAYNTKAVSPYQRNHSSLGHRKVYFIHRCSVRHDYRFRLFGNHFCRKFSSIECNGDLDELYLSSVCKAISPPGRRAPGLDSKPTR